MLTNMPFSDISLLILPYIGVVFNYSVNRREMFAIIVKLDKEWPQECIVIEKSG